MRIMPVIGGAAAAAAIVLAAVSPFMLRAAKEAGSPAGRLTYAPLPDDARPLTRIAFGSCADQDRAQPILDAVRALEPDLFIYAGNAVSGEAAHDAPDAGLPALRRAYARLARRTEFRRLIKSIPVMAVWGNLDYGRNAGGGAFKFRRESETLFRAFWGIGADDPRVRREGVYHARIFGPVGRRVQVILLDTRSFRSPLAVRADWKATGKPGYVADADPAKTMLGEEQWAWLERQLLQPAELRLVVSSIQVIAVGHRFEKWANLPLERQRLFDLIALTGAQGVLFLSGGRHAGGLYEYAEATSYPFYEVTSGALNKPHPAPGREGPHRLGKLYGRENFGMVEIDWQARSVTLELRDLHGNPVDGRVLTVSFDNLKPPG